MAKKKTTTNKSPVGNNARRVENARRSTENAMLARSNLIQRLLDVRRDIDDECGYKKPDEITLQDYHNLYDSEGTAQRVVHVLPEECWKLRPNIVEDEDPTVETEFEKAFDSLGRNLADEVSYFRHEEVNPVWGYLQRLDAMSRIGYFGCLLLGVDDGKELSEPLEASDNNRLIYLRVFPNKYANIKSVIKDVQDPRYGKPESYSLEFGSPVSSVGEASGFQQVSTSTRDVHWTRVIHVADNLEHSEIYGVPALRPVFNRLFDLRKLYGGSAEMYWRGAFPGYSFETHPQGEAAELDYSDVREEMEKYMTGLQRYLAISGVSVKSLAPQVVEPSKHLDKELEAICIVLKVPKRIFMGSERGELSSSEDKGSWNERLKFRQVNHVTPKIVVPFLDRCVNFGILPQPQQYTVRWPDFDQISATDRAGIAAKRTEAMVKYVGGNVSQLMLPIDWLTREMGYTEDEATSVVEEAAKEVGAEMQAEGEESQESVEGDEGDNEPT